MQFHENKIYVSCAQFAFPTPTTVSHEQWATQWMSERVGNPFLTHTLLPSLLLDIRTSVSELQAQYLRDSHPPTLSASEGQGQKSCREAWPALCYPPHLCSSPALKPVVPPHSWSAQMGPRPKYRLRPEELQWSFWAPCRIRLLAHSPMRSDPEEWVHYGRLLARMQPHSCGVLTSITAGVAKLTHFQRCQEAYETQRIIKACEPWGILQRWRSLEGCSFGPL